MDKIHEVGRLLNLAPHGVMGLNDMTPKFVSCPADMKVLAKSSLLAMNLPVTIAVLIYLLKLSKTT